MRRFVIAAVVASMSGLAGCADDLVGQEFWSSWGASHPGGSPPLGGASTDGATPEVVPDASSAADGATAPRTDAGDLSDTFLGEDSGLITQDGDAGLADVGPNPDERIVAWGDSLIARCGPAVADAVRRPLLNFGVGGQGSPGIAARQGSLPALVTLVDDQIPASGTARIEVIDPPPLTSQSAASMDGSLLGVRGTLFYRAAPAGGGAESFEFQRQGDAGAGSVSVPAATPFHPATEQYRGSPTIFWMGRNNYSDVARVVADIEGSTAYLSSNNFLVLSVLNGAGVGWGEKRGEVRYKLIAELNAELANAYGPRYVDVRAAVIAAYDPNNPYDVQNYADDVPPASLRGDTIHLNEKGCAVVGDAVAKAFRDLGLIE